MEEAEVELDGYKIVDRSDEKVGAKVKRECACGFSPEEPSQRRKTVLPSAFTRSWSERP